MTRFRGSRQGLRKGLRSSRDFHDDMMTVIDLLKTADEDTHNMPTKDRIRHLRAQYESSEHIKMPEPINTKRSDDEGLKTAIEGLQKKIIKIFC